MALIGLKKAAYAMQTQDDVNGLAYGTPVYLPMIQQVDRKPKYNVTYAYAEDQMADQAGVLDNVEIDVSTLDLSTVDRAAFLGQTIAANGGTYSSINDIPPFVAFLFKAEKRNGAFRYQIYYKGKFQPFDETAQTKEDKVTFNTPKIKGIFQHNINNGMMEWHVDSDDPNCPNNIDELFFASVIVPDSDTVAPVVTTTPVDGAIGVAANSSIVFTFSKAMAANTLTANNIFLMQADGTITATQLTINATNTVVTLTPAANLASGSYIAICTASVKSASGVALAEPCIVNFTV